MSAARYEKLCELSSRWRKNKETIGFSCQLHMESFRITYTFDKCPKKYRKSLTRLTDQLLKEAMSYIAYSFAFPVKDDGERDSVQLFLRGHMYGYLNILLESGHLAFEDAVSSDTQILQFSSVAASLEYKGGAWKNWKGEEFDPASGCWLTKGGESISDSTSVALWGILSDGKGKRKKFHAV